VPHALSHEAAATRLIRDGVVEPVTVGLVQRSAVVFDLDGTLADPSVALVDSFVHGLAAVGMVVEDRESLHVLVGPPLHHGLATYLGLTEPSLSVAVEAFRDYLGSRGLFEYTAYPGVVELVGQLRAAGIALGIATSKPARFAVPVLDHIGLTEHFGTVQTAPLEGAEPAKDQLVADALAALAVDASAAVVVGDRDYDILAGRAVGARTIGVAWGYGSTEELAAAGADQLVGSVDELGALLAEGFGVSRP
jgi:phosphoglycolate phosphatase